MKNRIKHLRHLNGMTLKELADRVGVGAPQISRWEHGDVDIPVSKLMALQRVFHVPVAEIMTPEGQPVPGAVSAREVNGIPVPMEGASAERMREDLPIFGTALGASRVVDGEAIEQTTLNTGEIIQYAKRPVILNGRADAYGLYVQGSSMVPAHQEGDLILAETKRPPRVGDDVVVYLRPNGDDDDGSRARGVLVKRLVRRTTSYVELEQFTPAVTFRIEACEVMRMDRVMRLTDLIA